MSDQIDVDRTSRLDGQVSGQGGFQGRRLLLPEDDLFVSLSPDFDGNLLGGFAIRCVGGSDDRSVVQLELDIPELRVSAFHQGHDEHLHRGLPWDHVDGQRQSRILQWCNVL